MSKRISVAQAYEKSLASFEPQRREKMDRYPPTRAYLLRCEFLSGKLNLPRLARSRAYLNLNGTFGCAYLPLGLGWLAFLIATFSSREGWGARWRYAALLIFLLHAYSFGINLTLAATHSLDITRYSQNQLVFLTLAEGFTAVLLVEALLLFARPQGVSIREV